MIPLRASGSELIGIDLRHRVTACRKRLRVNRNLQRAPANDEGRAFGGEATGAFLDEVSGMRESNVGATCVSEFRESETQLADQEVGIT